MKELDAPWETLTGLADEEGPVLFAAPYIKAPALRKICELLGERQITCVTRWTPEDIVNGSTDIEVFKIIADMGGDTRLHPCLHAKYYARGNLVLLGSANLTAQGLGYGGAGNFEILTRPSDDFNRDGFERALIDESHPITGSEYNVWEAIEDIAAAGGNKVTPQSPLQAEGAWMPHARYPGLVWQAYQGLYSEIVEPDQRDMARQDIEELALPADLDRRRFNAWLAAKMLVSPQVADVRACEHLSRGDRKEELARIWNIPLHRAARKAETVLAWCAELLPK